MFHPTPFCDSVVLFRQGPAKMFHYFARECGVFRNHSFALDRAFLVAIPECCLQLTLPECESFFGDIQQSVIGRHGLRQAKGVGSTAASTANGAGAGRETVCV
jgi:hypothetical protein